MGDVVAQFALVLVIFLFELQACLELLIVVLGVAEAAGHIEEQS